VSAVHALVLGAARSDDRVLVGVSLSERARRAAAHAGIAPERIHVVRDAADLAAARRHFTGPLVVVRARDQVVMPALVRGLHPDRPGTRVATDATGAHAGAMRLEPAEVPSLLAALEADLAEGDHTVAARLLASDVAVAVASDATTHHVARTAAEARAAAAWLWRFVHKPELDSVFTRYLCRPLARPLTRLFVRLPFTPNMITVFSILVGWLGCALAAGASYGTHLAGLAVIVFGNGLLDAVDGEVARLRLQFSRAGDWLDAFGDHTIRIGLILALGHHVAAQLPALPIGSLTLVTAAATLAAMAPMYWYCLSVHRTINLQHYGEITGGTRGWSSQLSSRDFTDYAFLVLAALGLSVISLAGTAAGALIALVTVVRAHPRAVRQRRAARQPAPA
jgi:phosphatidylglycerophosphate synthase